MHSRYYNRAALLFYLWLLLSSTPLLTLANELTSQERAIANRLSQVLPWSITKRGVPAQHPLGVQTLSIEADWKKHANGSRLARVYQFNHDAQQSRLLILNLDTRQTIMQHPIDSVHLPLSDAEINYAQALMDNADQVLAALSAEHATRSSRPITTIDQFDVKASIYEPLQTQHACQQHRCVLFALVDATLTVSSVEPLVNLATGDVQLLQSTPR